MPEAAERPHVPHQDTPQGRVDLRPIAHVVGWLLLAMAGLMLLPILVDLIDRRDGEGAFLRSAAVTGVTAPPHCQWQWPRHWHCDWHCQSSSGVAAALAL